MAERRLIAQGREAEVFLQPDGTVLKLFRRPAWSDRAEREAATLRVLAAGGVAAPALLGTVTVDGRPGLVLERLEGPNLLDVLGRRPWEVGAAGRAVAEVHVAMHDCVAPADLPDLHGLLRAQIESASPLPEPWRAGALRVLDGLPLGDRLCHGDLHLGNLLGTWAAPAVIDWGNAARGDPTADVARTDVLHRVGVLPPGSSRVIRAVAPLGRSLLASRYLASYRRRRPVDAGALDGWRVVRAAARLAEPIPEEHPRLLAYLGRRLTADGRRR